MSWRQGREAAAFPVPPLHRERGETEGWHTEGCLTRYEPAAVDTMTPAIDIGKADQYTPT